MEYIALKRGGIDWKHVPISGGPRLATALIGGHIHAYSAAGGHISFIKDGTMRLLVSYNKTRMKAAPDVPTLSELGLIDVTGGTPMVIIGPKGLPDSIPKKLESAFLKAMKDPSYLAFLDKVEFSPVFGGSQETRQGIEKQYEEWGKMIKTTGIKLEERKQ
jgi:tripartite-type tricarboxylate transporter receptor subunit TctC